VVCQTIDPERFTAIVAGIDWMKRSFQNRPPKRRRHSTAVTRRLLEQDEIKATTDVARQHAIRDTRYRGLACSASRLLRRGNVRCVDGATFDRIVEPKDPVANANNQLTSCTSSIVRDPLLHVLRGDARTSLLASAGRPHAC